MVFPAVGASGKCINRQLEQDCSRQTQTDSQFHILGKHGNKAFSTGNFSVNRVGWVVVTKVVEVALQNLPQLLHEEPLLSAIIGSVTYP